MPGGTKRKRLAPNGLLAGERLKRDKLIGPELYSQWRWISNIAGPSEVTIEHRRAACGFYDKAGKPICSNKYRNSHERACKKRKVDLDQTKSNPADGEDAGDVIVVASNDDEPPACTKKRCRDNPQCMNYVGQPTLEKDDALQSFLEAANLGPSPLNNAREPDLPIGLKNLGATCYANAFIQVWFQDRAFREGVYRCKPSQADGQDLEDSPIFQLQTTFAALQESTQNVFNPVKLVESLQIRASEQQDAQEFSKLFMSHLATEFEKQEVPSLKTLLSDQFEGKQTYGTMCRKCGHRSEQDADFLELEVNLEHNGKLEELVEALLQSEELTDDNKYYCTRCDSLQDATRYTKLRKLPPVLHISVLRFVFDLSSLSRKKSKQCILFPPVLDMSVFMDERAKEISGSQVPAKRNHQKLEETDNRSGLIYELWGVLLHKGPSAYHGHYEAQVFDSTTKQFYQFNDENVTPITSLQSQKGLSKDTKGDSISAAANKKRRTYSRKKARVEDSDGEIDKRPDVSQGDQNYISSKDAYMLIYAQRDVLSTDSSCDQVLEPPLPARERVARLNDEYDKECASYIERKKTLTNAFNRMRNSKRSIYSSWEITDQREESAVVSRDALLSWIMKDLEKPKSDDGPNPAVQDNLKERPSSFDEQHPMPSSDLSRDSLDSFVCSLVSDSHRLDNSGIVCRHGSLDPRKASEMKRIKHAAVTAIRRETNCFFEPELTTGDVCEYCVEELFLEKRYGLDHPRHVSQLEDICKAESDSQGAWISKRWLVDWRQVKPKMHITGQGDPPPDAPEYAAHVRCVHDKLSLVSTARKRISGEACAFLQSLFPTWRPLPEDTPTCETCDEELHLSKETKQELKKRADEEKSKLRVLVSTSLLGIDPEIIPGVPQAIVPTEFLRQWRAWLGRPHEKRRPGPIDNSWLVCEHGRLTIDPNVPRDLGASISLVHVTDWETLHALYGGGPLIRLTGAAEDGAAAEGWDVCHACRTARLHNFDTATITVRVLRDDEADPTPAAPGDGENGGARAPGGDGATATAPAPARSSVRLRRSRRTPRSREIRIRTSTTVRDMKVELHDALGVPTICQRLFFRGAELAESGAALAALGVVAGDTLLLREARERAGALDSDGDGEEGGAREEGRAFGGTVLGGGGGAARRRDTPGADENKKRDTPGTDGEETAEDVRSSSCAPAPADAPADAACAACTFLNARGRRACAMCDSPLGA